MRLAARTRRLERLLPPIMRVAQVREPSELLPAVLVEFATSVGCERHLADGELGHITMAEWFHRFSAHELVLIEEAARERLAMEQAAATGDSL